MRQSMALSMALCAALLSCGGNDDAGNKKPTVKNEGPTVLPPPAQPLPPAADSTDQSVKALEKQYALVPSDPALAYELAYAYAEEKNAKALRLADSLIRAKTPEIEKAYYSKAEYFSRINNVQEAIKNYDNAVAANLHFLDAQMDKGRLLFHQKQYAAALKSFATGQKLAPAEPMFYFWVAKTQEAMGQPADAKLNYERAYALDKSLVEAKERAANIK